MNELKRFKKFQFFTGVETAIIHFVAGKSRVRNIAGYKASDFTELLTTTITGRPYGCKSSVASIINKTLRDFVVRELAVRFTETSEGRPFVYNFSYAVVKAISKKLKDIEGFGLSLEEQAILLLVNEHKENFVPLIKEVVVKEIPLAKKVLDKPEYFTKHEIKEGQETAITYVPTELAYIYYNRWAELIQIYSTV